MREYRKDGRGQWGEKRTSIIFWIKKKKSESLSKSFTVGIGSGISISQPLLLPNPGFQVLEMLIWDLQKHRPQSSWRQHTAKDSDSRGSLLSWNPLYHLLIKCPWAKRSLYLSFLTSKMEIILTGTLRGAHESMHAKYFQQCLQVSRSFSCLTIITTGTCFPSLYMRLYLCFCFPSPQLPIFLTQLIPWAQRTQKLPFF